MIFPHQHAVLQAYNARTQLHTCTALVLGPLLMPSLKAREPHAKCAHKQVVCRCTQSAHAAWVLGLLGRADTTSTGAHGEPPLAHTRSHLSSARRGCSAHSAALTQNSARSRMMSARRALPPAHTRPHLSSARRGSSARSAALTQNSARLRMMSYQAGSHAAALEQRAPRVLRPLGGADPELGALAHDIISGWLTRGRT